MVLPSVAETDRPGLTGNEVNQIYRVFVSYKFGTLVSSDFAGWLSASFDDRFAFTPAGIPTAQEQLPLFTMRVSPNVPSKLPVSDWVRAIASRTHAKGDSHMRALEKGNVLETALAPCFAYLAARRAADDAP